jgi:hypothetical protein
MENQTTYYKLNIFSIVKFVIYPMYDQWLAKTLLHFIHTCLSRKNVFVNPNSVCRDVYSYKVSSIHTDEEKLQSRWPNFINRYWTFDKKKCLIVILVLIFSLFCRIDSPILKFDSYDISIIFFIYKLVI